MVSLVLAILSMFLVHPDRKYISYIDWHSITLLFCLMAVMAGFKETGLFRTIGNALLAHVHTTRQLFLVLVLLPFVFSMFITNDVSLITFVPFAIIVLSMSEKEHLIIPVVVMQTIAANLGSMLMPMGIHRTCIYMRNPACLSVHSRKLCSPLRLLRCLESCSPCSSSSSMRS